MATRAREGESGCRGPAANESAVWTAAAGRRPRAGAAQGPADAPAACSAFVGKQDMCRNGTLTLALTLSLTLTLTLTR